MKNDLKKRQLACLVALSGIGAFIILLYHDYVFFSNKITLEVIKNDATEECYPRRAVFFGEKRRSSSPETSYAGYCGAIFTTMGDYKLPTSSEYWEMHQGRAYLQRNLIEGCSYEVTIVGYGGKFEKGDRPRYPIRQRITRIDRIIICSN